MGSATVSFGLVSVPVKLYSSSESSGSISFNWIHRDCGSRLKQQYICDREGTVVSRDEMVKGYEFSKNQYVLFSPDELKVLEEKGDNTIAIEEFVPADQVDKSYLDRIYYLGPDKGGDRAYRLLSTAMRQTGLSALGRYAARGKQYLVLVRPGARVPADGEVADQEMDCGIRIDTASAAAECVPMSDVKCGDQIVVGRTGVRIHPIERDMDTLVERLVERAKTIEIGNPEAEATQLGPLALKAQLEKVQRYVEYGVADGARIAAGGHAPQRDDLAGGWYFEPTVFTDVRNDMRIARDEIFGPVLAMMKFKTEDELIGLANDTAYGLAAGVWTKDIDRALRFARDVDAGTVWVNTYRSAAYMSPAGGFKQSGYGKIGGFEAIRTYSRVKSVVIDYSGQTHDPFVMRLK